MLQQSGLISFSHGGPRAWLGAAVVACVVGCGGGSSAQPSPTPTATGAAPLARTVKVATWNIRSGMGIRGFTTTNWSHETLNCTNRSQPLNAWGMGIPQAELEQIRGDQLIVALAVQEAWNCAFPVNINGVLGFKTASSEREGVALFARYGFSSPIKYQQIDARANRWIVGGDVCLDPACSATLPIFSTHFGASDEDDVPAQAQKVIDFLAGQPAARLFMGDLNVYKTDGWNPSAPCTGNDVPARVRTIGLIEGAGYSDAWKATQGGEGWTGMASRPGCGSPAGNLFKRIDYIYTTGGLRVVTTDRFARAAPGADSPSDHVGLSAVVSIPAAPGARPE